MKTIGAALLTAFTFCSGGAMANETFLLSLRGTGFHLFNPYECDNFICPYPGYPFSFNGIVEIETSAGTDGVYTGSDLIGLSFVSTRGSFEADGFFKIWNNYFVGPTSVTIADGGITSVQAGAESFDGYERFALSGMTATYRFGDCHHCGLETATGTLIPAIPEPDTNALLLGGLAVGLTLLRGRRARRSTST